LSNLKEKIRKVEIINNDIEITLNDFYNGFPYTKTVEIEENRYPVMVWGKNKEQTWADMKEIIITELQNFESAIERETQDITMEMFPDVG